MLVRQATGQCDPLIFSADHINSAWDEVDIPRHIGMRFSGNRALYRHRIPVIEH
jgi:hypothetical protein